MPNPNRLYEDAQVLIAAGIVRKTWGYFFGGLVIIGSILAWMGYDLRNEQNILMKEIEKSKEEIDMIVSESKNKLQSQTNQQDLLNKRLNYLERLIQTASTLPIEYSKLVANQSEAFGRLTEKNNNQLETTKKELQEISSANSDLIKNRSRADAALNDLEQFQNKLEQRLVSLEKKVHYRWDEIIRTKEKNKIIPRLRLRLKFDTEGGDLSMRKMQLWDDKTKKRLCPEVTELLHKKFVYLRTEEGGLFKMTNRYVVDIPGGNGSLVGLRFEKLDSELESEQETAKKPICSSSD